MIVSHYLSEPDNNPVSTPHAGSDRPGRLFSSPFRAARSPFKRLEFWTASHPLSYKLRLYQVSEPKVNMWQGFTWETLRYWNELMSGEDVPRLDESRIPDLDRLIYAEPFAD